MSISQWWKTTKVLNTVFSSPDAALNAQYKNNTRVLNLVYNPSDECLNVNITNLYDVYNSINNRYVFRESFTGDGASKSFQLTGAIGNGTWSAGTWDAANIKIQMPCDATRTDFGALYDGTNIFTRHRVTVTGLTASGLATTDYAPRDTQEFYIWYWYALQDGDLVIDYYREDYVSEMETGSDHTHVKADITDFNEFDYVHTYSASTQTIDSSVNITGTVDAPTGSFDNVLIDGNDINDLFVNVTGDTMTGNLSINANLTVTGNTSLQALTAYTINISTFTGTAETLITTSGSSLLQSYLTTDSEWITNSTIISALLNQSNWLYDTYTGSTTGLIEGQKYACCNYLYIYTNSTLYRYKNANPTISLYSSYTTAGTNSDVVFVSGATPFTLMMPAASSLVLGECRLKNIGPADVTLSATSSTFDGNTSLTATTGSSYCLVAYVNNYYLL